MQKLRKREVIWPAFNATSIKIPDNEIKVPCNVVRGNDTTYSKNIPATILSIKDQKSHTITTKFMTNLFHAEYSKP